MEIKNIVNATQYLLEESNKLLQEKNKEYYNDVLDFMNLLFSDDAKILTRLKFNKITLNDNVFKLYNQIIKKYKLSKPVFDMDKFNFEEIENLDEIKKIFCDIAFKFSNNLLERLNYKLKKKFNKEENKIKLILQNTT